MKCEEIREMMPDLASGVAETTPEMGKHLAGCGACSEKLKEFQQTMALLDEWQASEPSPYFDVRLQARLREEMAKPQTGMWDWLRRPALAVAFTLVIGVGVGLFVTSNHRMYKPDELAAVQPQMSLSTGPGTAVSDLQSLEKNHDLYSDFDLLDDLEVQHDVTANP
jgi:anti-sigma factor RsiW